MKAREVAANAAMVAGGLVALGLVALADVGTRVGVFPITNWLPKKWGDALKRKFPPTGV
jgi:hypothetical protein